jgi:hypothetical protein
MQKLLIWLLIFSLEAACVGAPSFAVAQTTGTAYSGLSAINKIINSTPGINVVNIAGKTTVSASAAEAVAVDAGLTIAVATGATSSISGTALAGIAAKAIRAGGLIGVATIVVPMVADALGLYICPPPDFVCKRDPKGPAASDIKGAYIRVSYRGDPSFGCMTTSQACTMAQAAYASCQEQAKSVTPGGYTGQVQANPSANPNPSYSPSGGYSYSFYCFGVGNGAPLTVNAPIQSTCPTGYHLDLGQCVRDGSEVPKVPATESDISGALAPKLNSSAANQGQIYDLLTKSGVPVFASSDAVTVTAPPVTAQPQTKTEQITNPDGSTSTKTTTTQTTVTPNVTGSNIGNTTITYPTTTTTTTTITNNITNVSTTTTTTDTKTITPPPKPAQDLPTDYSREATQQAILRSMQGENVPTTPTSLTSADPAVSSVDTQNKTNIGTLDTITPGSTGVAGWFPTIPTAACSNPQVPNPITGQMVSVQICDKVDIFSTFINGVIAVLCLFGCIREVQVALKA